MDMTGSTNRCAACADPCKAGAVICDGCVRRWRGDLWTLAMDVPLLQVCVDASVKPAGTMRQEGKPSRDVAPTPVRLGVLDLLDLTGAYAAELAARCAHTAAPTDEEEDDEPPTDTVGALIHAMRSNRLPLMADAPMYMDRARRLADTAENIVNPPEQAEPIGTCDRCGTLLTATENQRDVTCPACGKTHTVKTVRLKRLERLCWDESHHAGASQIAATFTKAGMPLKRNTITQWNRRGKLARHPDGYAYADVYRLLIGPKQDRERGRA